MTENKRFVKYDGNTIVDLKLVKSWIISNGNVELLLEILNNEKTSKKGICIMDSEDNKMTEDNRFVETISTGIVTDTVTGKEYDCEMRINDNLMMYDDWSPRNLNKEEMFRDYVGRYTYKDINKALDDFDEIYNIINKIGEALQWSDFNNISKRSIEERAVYIYYMLSKQKLLPLNYPFKEGDRYVQFSPVNHGD